MKNIDIKKLRTPDENEKVAIWLNLEDVINYIKDEKDQWKETYKFLNNGKKKDKQEATKFLSKVIVLEHILSELRHLRE